MDAYEEVKKKVIDLPMKYNYRKDYLNYLKTYSEGFNYWLNISEEDKKTVDILMEQIYFSCFTLDDIIDDSKIRRGEPTAYCIYGTAFTLNAGLLANVQAIHDALNMGKPEAANIVIETIRSLYEGQGMEAYWRDYNICPTEDEYKRVSIDKSGAIPIGHCKLLQLFSNNKTDYTDFTKRLALYYQLVNDNLALSDDLYQKKKGCLSDIAEGKYTLPIIHAIGKEGSDPKLRNILKMHTDSLEIKQCALSLLKKHKSLDYAENVINKLREELLKEINELGGNPIFGRFDNLEYYEEDL